MWGHGGGGGGGGGDGGSSLSWFQLLRPSQLAFTREPERGAGGGVGGGGGDRRRSRWLLVSCGDGSGSKKFLPPKTVSWELLTRTVATTASSFMGGPFYPPQRAPPWPLETVAPAKGFMGALFYRSQQAKPTIRITLCSPAWDRPPQWKGRNFFKKTFMADLI